MRSIVLERVTRFASFLSVPQYLIIEVRRRPDRRPLEVLHVRLERGDAACSSRFHRRVPSSGARR